MVTLGGRLIGDVLAFKIVTERLSPQLMRFVSSYLHGDVHTAHDVVQDTFVTAWGKLGEIRDRIEGEVFEALRNRHRS